MFLLLDYHVCRRLSGSEHWVYSGCPSLPVIGQQVPTGSVREVDPFGAAVVLFTMRLHTRFDAWLG